MIDKSNWLFKKGPVWALILIVGPFALPLLWFSPHFTKTSKLYLTALLILLTLLMLYGGLMLMDLAKQYGIPLT